MKYDFRENKWDHVTYKSLKDRYGNPYQLMSFNLWVFKPPGGICCQFCGVPMQLASVNRHDSCAYFKKKKEIELKLGITEEPQTDGTVRFRPDEQEGYTYAAADEPVEENSESDDSVVAGASPGGKEGGADSEEESISKPGET